MNRANRDSLTCDFFSLIRAPLLGQAPRLTVGSVSEYWPAAALSHRMTNAFAACHGLSAVLTTVSLTQLSVVVTGAELTWGQDCPFLACLNFWKHRLSSDHIPCPGPARTKLCLVFTSLYLNFLRICSVLSGLPKFFLPLLCSGSLPEVHRIYFPSVLL